MKLETLARAAGETSSPYDFAFPLRFGLEAFLEPAGEFVSAEESEKAVRDAQVWLEDIVRAILLALREPDEGMVVAMLDAFRRNTEGNVRAMLKDAHTAVIDHLLGDARP